MKKTPDAYKASSARIYDYFLDGTDNYQVDREAAEQFLAAVPTARNSARATRGFVLRVARWMAEQGLTQFLDIGCGIPTTPNVHEVIWEVRPDARVVYVDNDRIVLAKGQALRDEPGVITVEGDLRNPAGIFADPEVRGMVDFSQPIGVLTVAVWHFLPDDALDAALAELRAGLPAGSWWAMSHACTESLTPAQVRAAEALYRQTTNPVRGRSRAEIHAMFDGFDLTEPGLVPLHEWRPRAGDPYPEPSPEALAGVGILRET
ncbi:SAM-dependent methyltransferase [Nonomuraea sp. NPDC049646]|uniref:SAM-dependent methyltransferase n=1 Tax=unclassified Nonomuraea TaxID=2593643 RepID=UPI00379720EB